MLEPKILSQRLVDTPDGGGDKRPALLTYLRTLAASTHVVVLVHIYIKNQLALERPKTAPATRHARWTDHIVLLVMLGRNREDCTNINFIRQRRFKGILELVCRPERKVSTIYVAWKGERKLAPEQKVIVLPLLHWCAITDCTVAQPSAEVG